MWYLERWFSNGLGSARSMSELDDLKDISQSKAFYDSTNFLELGGTVGRAGGETRKNLT